MKGFLEDYCEHHTLLHRWDAKLKIIGFMALIFSFSFIKTIDLVPVMIGVSIILWKLSKISFSVLVRRWRIPSLFILIMDFIYLFFSNGAILFPIGSLHVTDTGLTNALLLTSRFLCILTLVTVLLGTTSYIGIIKGMRELGLPSILTDMFLFTYRYIFEMGNNLEKMQRAMGLRGFKGKRIRDMGKLSALVGAAFVRSYDQSDRVYHAMTLRGYGENK